MNNGILHAEIVERSTVRDYDRDEVLGECTLPTPRLTERENDVRFRSPATRRAGLFERREETVIVVEEFRSIFLAQCPGVSDRRGPEVDDRSAQRRGIHATVFNLRRKGRTGQLTQLSGAQCKILNNGSIFPGYSRSYVKTKM